MVDARAQDGASDAPGDPSPDGASDAPGDPSPDGASDAPGDPSNSIYAMAVGRSWRWHFVSAANLDCDIVGTITGTIDIDGRHAFVESYAASSCAAGSDSYIAVDANDRMEMGSSDRAGWSVWDPPSEGHTWDVGGPLAGLLYTWHATPSTTVPAGTFSDCWTATAMPSGGGAQQVTYCRGVGGVDTEASSSSGFAFFSRLISKNF